MTDLCEPLAVGEQDVQEWQSFVGRQKTQYANADAEVLRRFALAAEIDADVEQVLPDLAHWALFVDAVSNDKLGSDGHPKRGDFLPNVSLPRRMFAAAKMRFNTPLQINKTAKMVSTITSVDHKSGRSGDLVFVKVRRDVSQSGELCVSEEQTIVYRGDGPPVSPIKEREQSSMESLKSDIETWAPNTVNLFRFSTVTYNSHRIHYDLPYARQHEGYPGLVVHGPFTAVKLLDYARRKANRRVRTFSFRGLVPLFVEQPILLSAGDNEGEVLATRCDGNTAMIAKVEFI